MKYAQKYTAHLLCYAISLEEKASRLLQCISRSTIREFWICINPHARSVAVSASFLPIHIVHRSLPCCMELFSCCVSPFPASAPALKGGVGWIQIQALEPVSFLTGRFQPCAGADPVKLHGMISAAARVMPGAATVRPEGSTMKCQSSSFMNAIHRVPWLLTFSKACCKSLPSSSVHTLKEKVQCFLTVLPEQH